MNVIIHQTSDRKFLMGDSDKHKINMDQALQIFHINKWINNPSEPKPLAYVKPACAPKPTYIIYFFFFGNAASLTHYPWK